MLTAIYWHPRTVCVPRDAHSCPRARMHPVGRMHPWACQVEAWQYADSFDDLPAKWYGHAADKPRATVSVSTVLVCHHFPLEGRIGTVLLALTQASRASCLALEYHQGRVISPRTHAEYHQGALNLPSGL